MAWALDELRKGSKEIRPPAQGVEDALKPGYLSEFGETLTPPNFKMRDWKPAEAEGDD